VTWADASGFVGREGELRQFSMLLDGLMAGVGTTVLVSGEGGMGKTRLCEELTSLARQRGTGVAWSACWEGGGFPPFWPLRQLLDQCGAELTLTASAGDSPDLARAELFASVADALRSVTRAQPWLFVLDDAQWADAATIQLVTHIAPFLRSLPALLVVTVRESDDRFPVLSVDLRRHARSIRLAGLTFDELGSLVETVTSTRPTAAVTASLHRVTGGNPLFAGELARRLHERGRIDDLAHAVTIPVPPTVRAVLDEQLGDLSPACREILAVGALIGAEFPVDLVDEVAVRDRREVLRVIDEGRSSRVLVDAGVGRYAFSHPLLRSVVFDDIGIAERVSLHFRIAEALEAAASRGQDVDLAALSFHYLNAAPGGSTGKAVHYAQLAAGAAMSVLGYEDAVELYDRALTASQLDSQGANITSLLLGAGEARAACADTEGARQAFLDAADRARRSGDWPALAAAALGLGGNGFEVPLFDAEQIELLEVALGSLANEDLALRARVCARLSVALSLSGHDQRRAELSDEAVRLAERSGDQAALAEALAARCDAHAGPAHVALRAEAAGDIVRLGQARGDRGTELLGRRLRLVAALERGEVIEVDAEALAFERVADTLRQPRYQWYVKLWRAMRAVMCGDIAGQQALADEAERLGHAVGSVNCEILLLAHRWFASLEAGEVETALSQLDALAPSGTFAEMGPQMVPVEAGRRLLAGYPDEARAALDVTAAEIQAAKPDAEWLTMVAQVADVCFRLGGHPLVPWLYDTLLAFADLWSVDGIGAYAHGPVHRQLGLLAALLGRESDADAHFEAALAGNRRAGAHLLIARTLLDRGMALAEPDTLRAAQRVYRQLGIGRRCDEIDALLTQQSTTIRTKPQRNLFRRDGDVWTIAFDGRQVSVRDAKGHGDLSRLLAQPGREIAALDLAAPAGSGVPGGAGLGLSVDHAARAAYKARLLELEAELDDADARSDLGRSDHLHLERDALIQQLASAYGLGGRPRRSGEPSERARTAVTARLRDAIRRIGELHPELGRHLSRSVRTGTFCSYDPDPPVMWEL
jgi:tetratricopeptide (TPR) repeat protein